MRSDVDERVADTQSVRGALFALKSDIALLGGCHIGYEFVVRARGHLRSDLIAATTLPNSFWDVYKAGGGSSFDPVLSRVSAEQEVFRIDLSATGKNQFFTALAELGCVSIATYTLPKDEIIGNLALSVMEDQMQRDRGLDADLFVDLLRQTHSALRRYGHIHRHFGLSLKECNTLSALAQGQAAADIAEVEGIAVRSVEKRLQNVRQKLRAATTVEAMFKAVAYGVISGDEWQSS